MKAENSLPKSVCKLGNSAADFSVLPFAVVADNVSGMMKSALTIFVFCSWAVLSTLPLSGQQSYPPTADEFTRPEGPERLTRKSGSVFRRPARDTPGEQLGYARELEAVGRWRRASNQYDALVHRWHHAEEAPTAQLAYARLLYERRRYERAFKEFQYMVQFFPGLFDYGSVLDYQLRIANQAMGRRRATFGVFPGFESPERALPMLETIIANAPNGNETPSIRLTIGMIHEGTKDLDDAVKAYEAVIYHHPGSDAAKTATFRKAVCLADLSDKSPRDEQRCREAFSALVSFLGAYPQSEEREEAFRRMDTLKLRLQDVYYQRARYYDEIEKRPAAALISYREFLKQFPASPLAERVTQRIEALDAQTTVSEGK